MPTYFAYGSNLLASRLRLPARAPNASVLTTGHVVGFDLRFHKRGADGSGKCDLVHTGSPDHRVWGVVWRLEDAELQQLDRSEGGGYQRRPVELVAATGEHLEAESYCALPAAIDPQLTPFDWYLRIVVAGALANRLPPAWIDRLQAVEALRDPDEERRSRFLSLVP